jgi:hypothetical protein
MDLQLNLNVICRICLCDGDMRALDSQTDGNSTYKDKILQCTNIRVKFNKLLLFNTIIHAIPFIFQLKTNYNFPEQICIKCVADLEIAYRFRMNCESSDAILNTYLQSNLVKQEKFDKIEYLDDDDMEFGDHTFDDDDQVNDQEVLAEGASTRTQPVFSLPFPKPLLNIKDEQQHDGPDVLVLKKKAKPRVKKIKVEQNVDTVEKKVGITKQLQICELCGSQCRSSFEMRIHMRRHKGKSFQGFEFLLMPLCNLFRRKTISM